MKKYETKDIRNVCLVSHGGVGKTSLVEAALYTSKGTSKLGKVDNGTSIMDSRIDEKERKMTISLATAFCEWKDVKINFLDTPGFLDFIGEMKAALSVAESSIILISASDGIQVGTEIVHSLVEEKKMPRLFFINGLDKDNVNFENLITELREEFGTSVAPICIPLGTGQSFKGVVNLITKEAFEYSYEGNGIGKKVELPQSYIKVVEEMRLKLMESVAESNEELMNKYFENGVLTDSELNQGLAKGFEDGVISPLLCGSAALNIGTDLLLDAIATICPSPLARKEIAVTENKERKMIPCNLDGPTAAFVFKTLSEEHLGEFNLLRVFNGKVTIGQELANISRSGYERVGNLYFLRGRERYDTQEVSTGDLCALLKLKDTHTNDTLGEAKNVTYEFEKIKFPEPLVDIAVSAKNKGDEDKIATGMAKLHEEDPVFTFQYRVDIRQSILSAMGDIHIDVILENLKRRFKVDVERKPPKISYRETITKTVKYVEYTHKKQSGGAGQYAKVFIDLEPMERGGGYEFVDKIVGGVIDGPFRPSVDKGIQAKLKEGILAGYPIVDLRVYLVDGKTHPVDSKDIAFQIAGREVFKKAFEMASPILLEPIVDIRVTVPDIYTGDVMGDLSSRRAKISGIEPGHKRQTIVAKVPESEIQTYSQTLRALTQGRGFYTKSFSHYEPVPTELAKKIIEASQKELASATS